ncbi:TPA: hypothetical protein ACPSKZ_000713 [Legionella anisa]|uniref:hypothetical protein n=1 Tax=Legionella anisa TaxID=28082 RepID=UPI002243DC10|nr:hypothetical protein [Legionella anisa]MCW8425589.1 hypothetical protein [Legionella anisa]MCW8448981.1 hypothetical protein [Legionella anisa]
MKKIIIPLLLWTASNSFAATYYNCSGSGMNVSGDASGNIWINGQHHVVSGKTMDGQGVVTENYINNTGTLVYASLYPVSANSLKLSLYNAVTQYLITSTYLSCTFSLKANGKQENLFDQKHFSAIKQK